MKISIKTHSKFFTDQICLFFLYSYFGYSRNLIFDFCIKFSDVLVSIKFFSVILEENLKPNFPRIFEQLFGLQKIPQQKNYVCNIFNF